jgi:hypothetical protein
VASSNIELTPSVIYTDCRRGCRSKYIRGRRGRDRMVVGYPTTCAISAYHHQTWGQLHSNVIDYITITLQFSWFHYITITSIFKCNRLHYNYFVNVIDYITDYIESHDNQYISVLCYFVSCLSVQYPLFNVFLTQNYELQLSFNVIITCNNIQYIVNYKQQFSFSFFKKICCVLLL